MSDWIQIEMFADPIADNPRGEEMARKLQPTNQPTNQPTVCECLLLARSLKECAVRFVEKGMRLIHVTYCRAVGIIRNGIYKQMPWKLPKWIGIWLLHFRLAHI